MNINWPTGVITVYKNDPFVTFTGGQVYDLDTNGFRLALKALEDDEIGMAFPVTHRHNTTVLLGGIEYARILEILSPYTVTFDDSDGGWVCNLIGSNNNILDRTNLTSVQVRSNNSAGLIQTKEIQYSIFNGGVTVDTVNGVPGTQYPIGTPLLPCNNITDARTIAVYRGFGTFYIIGDITLDTGDDISNFRVIGQNAARTMITINPGAYTYNSEIMEAAITGELDGNTIIRSAYIFDLSYVNGFLFDCELAGHIDLGGGTTAHIISCFAEVNTVTIDMNNIGNSLNMQAFSGDVVIVNKTSSDQCGIHLISGKITIDSSVTNTDNMHISGVASVTNNSGLPIVRDESLSTRTIWGIGVTNLPVGGIGEWIYKKVLTIPKFIGLK